MNKSLVEGNIRKALWAYTIPLLGSVVFQQLYNLADSVVAGRFIGELALAAVGNASEITLIYTAFAVGSNVACSVIASQFFGAKDYKALKTSISTSFVSFAVLCLVLMGLGFSCLIPMLRLINTPDTIFQDSLDYLYIYTAGMPFVFFYNICTGVFSAMGDSKTPFIFLAISSVSNILMDILFVSVFNMGVKGVAWATFICQGLSCLLAIAFLYLKLKKLESEKYEKFSKVILKKLLIVAIPSILQQLSVSIGNIAIQGVVNNYGDSIIAGYTAAIKLINIVTSAFFAVANGVSAYVAQNIGAKNLDRIKGGFNWGQMLAWIVAVPLFIAFMFFGKYTVGLFLDVNASADALNTGVTMLRVISPFYFVVSAKIVADGALRGSGDMKHFMLSTFTDLFVRVACVFVFTRFIGVNGVWWSWPVGWILGMLVAVGCFYSGKWKKYSNLIVG